MLVNSIHRQFCSLIINITYSLRLERCHKAFKVVRGQKCFDDSNLDDGEGITALYACNEKVTCAVSSCRVLRGGLFQKKALLEISSLESLAALVSSGAPVSSYVASIRLQ